MMSPRTKLLAGLALAGQTFVAAAEPDCYYGEDEYTSGAILCQAGLTMQCKRDEEGQALWVSLNQQCTDPAIATDMPAEPNDARGGEMGHDFSSEDPTAATPEKTAGATGKAGRATPESNDKPSTAAREAVTKSGTGTGFVIEILWADYGRDGKSCDAAPAVTERCGGKAECDVAVNPRALCGDPFPGQPKLLSVYWRCTDGSEFHLQRSSYGQDDNRINLQCSQAL